MKVYGMPTCYAGQPEAAEKMIGDGIYWRNKADVKWDFQHSFDQWIQALYSYVWVVQTVILILDYNISLNRDQRSEKPASPIIISCQENVDQGLNDFNNNNKRFWAKEVISTVVRNLSFCLPCSRVLKSCMYQREVPIGDRSCGHCFSRSACYSIRGAKTASWRKVSGNVVLIVPLGETWSVKKGALEDERGMLRRLSAFSSSQSFGACPEQERTSNDNSRVEQTDLLCN